jgi:DNA-binding helix-hairpin-helix protein with protein kinase domain
MEAPVREDHEYPDLVADTDQGTYRVAALLGEGGQGAVFRTHDSNNLAVKLIFQKDVRVAQDLQARMVRMEARPLWNWPISRLTAVLRPGTTRTGSYRGYVMDLRDATVGMLTLVAPLRPSKTIKELKEWYHVSSGGLRRRLMLLARAAETLAWLNGLPFVYADPSPNNILIPENHADEDVWLIDPDNIGLVREPESGPGIGTPGVVTAFTPGYAAPEIYAKNQLATTLSDRFAFAVVAFQVLTLEHPYIGDEVQDSPADVEQQAFRGEWPYIDHPTDRRNECTTGLGRRRLLDGGLRMLAQRTFVEGRDNPLERPSLGAWAEGLRRAADMTLPCPQCRANFYPFAGDPEPVKACPWKCGTPRTGFAYMNVRTWAAPFGGPEGSRWPGGVPLQPSHANAVVSPEGLIIRRRHAVAGSFYDRHEKLMEVRYEKDGLLFSPLLPGFPILIGEKPLAGPEKVRWRRNTDGSLFIGPVRFGPSTEDHRIATFYDHPAP